MTRQDPSPVCAHPDSDQAPENAAGSGHARRPRAWAPLCLLGFLAIYLAAVCTPAGQRAENTLLSGDGAEPAWIYDWSGAAYKSPALPPLDQSAMPTLLVGIAVITAVTLVRRCWWQGCAATGLVVATLGSKELTKMALPRPDLVDAPVWLTEPSFPSGHVAVAAGLALAATLIASPRIRPYATAAGMLWLAVTAGAVQATYHHRPSDALGSTLLACACYSLATRLLPAADDPNVTRPSRALPPAIALALSAAGALPAGARDDSIAQSLIFAATALLCAALFWLTTAGKPAQTARRTLPGA
ncbi:phosphatase PAP2 family protein [Actinomadura violacea]|uniref:Phosphatase PAP2 family protein n=1 Tax=Actinomadura violacea TaxID=2819934 RepID=A0ABS3RPE8_9ACTN|nr:phosphatase PAP2 family protein [Actinomadura violacea]MBO2458183.1 phosphatase PAP2 family protein [Actinomadura violacea]